MAHYGLSFEQCCAFMAGHPPPIDDLALVPYSRDRAEMLKLLKAVSKEDRKRIESGIGYIRFFSKQLDDDDADHHVLIAGYLPREFELLEIPWSHLKEAAWYIPDAPKWVRDCTGLSPDDFEDYD